MANQTELINHAMDLQVEYNLKLLLLFLFTAYSLFAIWYWRNHEVEYLAQYYLRLLTTIMAKIWFVALPLWIFFTYRGVPIDVMFRPLIIVYGLAGMIFFFYVFVFGGEKVSRWFSGEEFWRGRK